MSDKSQQREAIIAAFNMAIEAVDLARKVSSVTGSVRVTLACATVSKLLTIIRNSINDEQDHSELKSFCDEVSRTLSRGSAELGQFMRDAIIRLKPVVAKIQSRPTLLAALLQSRGGKKIKAKL